MYKTLNKMLDKFWHSVVICVTCLFLGVFGIIGNAMACESGQIDVNGDGTNCVNTKFSVTTTELAANTEFKFSMYAKGTFYVDWGDGNVQTIDRTDTSKTTYPHTYTSGGIKTIRMAGLATGYATGYAGYAIAFGTYESLSADKIAAVSGDLSAMFPYIPGNGTDGQQPRFYILFYGASNLTSVPDTLFSGYTTGVDYMFHHSFYQSGLTSVPAGLFRNITTGANSMFWRTFQYSNLTGYIPLSTFAGLINNGHPIQTDMWYYTFSGTNLATSCPEGAQQFITGYESYWDSRVACMPDNTIITVTLDTTNATTPGALSTVYMGYNTAWYSDSTGNTAITNIGTLPAKDGLTFGGFYTGANATGAKVIDENGNFLSNTFAFMDTTLYAYFGTPYTVTYSCGDATGTAPTSTTAFSGAPFTTSMIGNCSKEGYMFTGWAVSGTDDVKSGTFTWDYTENKTLTAQWEQIKFTITTTELAANTVFKFSMSAKGTFKVDWGDGNVQTIDRTNTSDTTYQHTYTSSGIKTIRMGGLATAYNTNTSNQVAAISFSTNSSLSGNLIASIDGSLGAMFPTLGQNNGQQPRFYGTFRGCSRLTSIPHNLFSGVSGSASYMFQNTFYGCSGLTTIPSGLFRDVSGGATYMFNATFRGCTGLTAIPEGLFSGVSTGFSNMFTSTFYDCSNLSGYIPPSTFAGLINNGSPQSSMWGSTFYNTALSTSCTGDTQQFITKYEGTTNSTTWNGKVSCYVPTEYTITYDVDDGTNYAGAPTTYMSGTGVVIDGTPTKAGYEFGGWCTSSSLANCAQTITLGAADQGNKIYYAKWMAIRNINYVLDGGTNYENAPTEYTEGIYKSINGVPTKSGYVFTGWCTDSGLQNCSMGQTIGTDATGDKTFYAKWEQCPSGYENSAPNATSYSQCYTTCITSDVAHATAVSGINYYRDGVDTCDATACETGYVVKPGGRALIDIITDYDATISSNINSGVFTLDYGQQGVISGSSECNGSDNNASCYCMLDTYTPFGGISESISTSKVFARGYDSRNYTALQECHSECHSYCATALDQQTVGDYQTRMFNELDKTRATCVFEISHSINYVLNGGTNYTGAPTEYGEGVGAIIDGIPTRSGYGFSGWCTDSGLTNCAWTQTISTSDTGNKTFYAKWTQNFESKFNVTTINLAANTMFEFSMSARGTFMVDWGDGTVETLDRSNNTGKTIYSHTYTTEGVKTIRFTGTAMGYNASYAAIAFGNGSNNELTPGLIASVDGSLGALFPTLGQNNGQQPRFYSTFAHCTNVTSIPDNLFSGISGAADYMFNGTFYNCTGLTSIPGNLFSGVSGAAEQMFSHTFRGCTRLTSVPGNLFSGVTGAASYMFYYTFYDCTGLRGYIPPSTFAGLINNGSPTADNTMNSTFSNTGLDTSCSGGTEQFITGYESNWNGKVSCYVPTQYTITYNMDSGTNYAGAPTTYMSGTGVTIDGVPTKSGYVFTGWCTDSELTDCAMTQTVGKASFSNKTFYANWTALYNINYELNGGTNYENAPMEYTEGTGATIDGVPTKDGYRFVGWCVDAGLQNCAMTQTISTDATGNKTFYAKWEAPKFTITTTELGANTSFGFYMAAAGDFWVDWGDGNVQTIDRTNNTNYNYYSHTYETAGVKTIKFGGLATGYNTSYSTIQFNSNYLIAGIDGSLGAIFPTLGQSSNQQPRFKHTFFGVYNLTSIPAGLFSGVSGAAENMFYQTFSGCSGLTSIPQNLFSGVSGSADGMFAYTFSNCSNLTTIPAGLFSGVTGAAGYMFESTFQNCDNLTTIPAGLFSGVSGASYSMFQSTFQNCSNLTTIPAGLFSGVSGAADYMFSYTFYNCNSLTTIPAGLFSGVTGTANYMFQNTFAWCENLTGYVPSTTFAGLVANGSPDYYGNIMSGIFDGDDKMDTACPRGTKKFTTGYESYWDSGQVSCQPATEYTITYELDGGTNYIGAPATYYDDAYTVTIDGTPSKTGYGFIGWCTDAELTDCALSQTIRKNSTGTKTFYAKWGAGSAINYVLNGGTNYINAPTAYAHGIGATIDGRPSKDGYIFDGWCTDAGLNNCAETQTISANETGDKTFWAKWRAFESKFSVTTIDIEEPDTTFSFEISAAGIFYVNWGDGSPMEVIDRTNNTEPELYEHVYETTGVKTIAFDGRATGYQVVDINTPEMPNAAIDFGDEFGGTPWLIASIDGSLGAIFPTLGNGAGQQPIFAYTFAGATNLTEIPSTLFNGVTGHEIIMFMSTFDGCESLTNIPAGLFSGISGNAMGMFADTFAWTGIETVPAGLFSGVSGAANYMFGGTFQNCDNLTTIPAGLFSGVSGAADGMFNSTFYGCSNLETIPAGLFSGIRGSASAMFGGTFADCYDLESIPATLFSGVSGSAWGMFQNTFQGCENLETIPVGLFSGVTGGAPYMFDSTFYGCTGITSIPENMFSGVTVATESMFSYTFSECNNLTGFVPASTFSGLVNQGSHYANNMMDNIFYDTDLFSECPGEDRSPGNYVQFYTNYEDYWDGAVSCIEEDSVDEYTITYVMNGGTNYKDAPTTYTTNSDDAVLMGIPTKSGYGFSGWCTDAQLTDCALYRMFKAETGDKTFYAKWTPVFQPKFSLTTVNMEEFTRFAFTMSAAGTFVVDWGDGTIETITKTSVADSVYEHIYMEPGSYTIKFDGLATGYQAYSELWSPQPYAAIAFGYMFDDNPVTTPELIRSIDGSLGAIFPTLGNGAGQQPMFTATFGNAENLTTIPAGLFNGITGNGLGMFTMTFSDCYNLTTIPAGLFSGVSGAAEGMFSQTFYNCNSLTRIPAGLFSGVSGGARGMFNSTFSDCYNLTSLPSGLFSGITDAAEGMFNFTFNNCGNLSGYIPSSVFAGLIANDNPDADGMMECTFCNTSLYDWCPSGSTEYITGYENAWGDRALCEPAAEYTITYELSGGTNYNDAPATYLSGMNTEINGVPTRDGYIFTGWCDSAARTNCDMSYYISDGDRGDKTIYANWIEAKFTITTVDLDDNNGDDPQLSVNSAGDPKGGAKGATKGFSPEFGFMLSAAGEFWVDWGDGSIEYFDRTIGIYNSVNNGPRGAKDGTKGPGTGNLDNSFYSHNYSTGGVKTIKFGGLATEYSTPNTSNPFDSKPTITFNGSNFGYGNYAGTIASVSGSLGAIFPTVGTGRSDQGDQPMFYGTFNGAENLTAIPATLFSGVTGNGLGMFAMTFAESGLTEIPATLFSGITGSTMGMFYQTFYRCPELTEIPATLFSGITGNAYGLFGATFADCSGLETIPATLFSGVTGAAEDMFNGTFYGCSNLETIPADLFSGVTGGATNMFFETFRYCNSLTSIPAGLFSGVDEAEDGMFNQTFSDCNDLSSYIPASVFAGLIARGDTPDATGMMTDIFANTNLATSCQPYNMSEYETGYEDYWDGHVACYVPDTYNITYEMNGGTNYAGAPTTYTSGTGVTIDGVPTKAGYIFAGWCTNSLMNNCSTELVISPAESSNKTVYARWAEAKFTITTLAEMPEDEPGDEGRSGKDEVKSGGMEFGFGLSARGTFFIDWGDGDVEIINKDYDGMDDIWHLYETEGVKVIKIGGLATEYVDETAITFDGSNNYSCDLIESVSGSLGAIFPTIGLGQSDYTRPYFASTFRGCRNMISIPATLFSGVSGNAPSMFADTFSGCKSLTSVPANLFSGVSGAAEGMFDSTFADCSNLETIPAGLFSGVSGAAEGMFAMTFSDCYNLTTIPAGLFSGITGIYEGEENAGQSMFNGTFRGCKALTTIPSTLFSNVVESSSYMFQETFEHCKGLTALPDGLFSSITNAAEGMFQNTFNNCQNLSGYVPMSLFSGLVNNGSPDDWGNVMNDIFNGTNLDTECPSDMRQFITEYEGYWDGRVSCYVPVTYKINYVLNGGRNPGLAPTSYEYGEGELINFVPTKAGNIFAGWCTDSELTNCSLYHTISRTDEGNRTYYAKWTPAKFSITTTEMGGGFIPGGDDQRGAVKSSGDDNTFAFSLTARGMFYVDWGDGKMTIIDRTGDKDIIQDSYDLMDDEPIIIDDPVYSTGATRSLSVGQYSHTYEYQGVWTIRIGGLATEYATEFLLADDPEVGPRGGASGTKSGGDEPIPAISFNDNSGFSCDKIAELGGSLGAVFPTLGNDDNEQPGFISTFQGCQNLTTLPATLFSGVTGAAEGMFDSTFYGCSNLETIPAGLFSGVSGAADNMFNSTFYNCSSLETIPATLFSGITGAADWMFSGTFSYCSNLTTIPAGLFSGVSGAAEGMFNSTFYGCSNLETIPAGLFSGITGAADYMFQSTFQNCYNLTTIPAGLFSGVNAAAPYMFNYTFAYCYGLDGYIVPSTFQGLIDNGSPTANGSIMNDIFYDTGLYTECPNGTREFNTGYEDYWNRKVACEPLAEYTITYELNGGTNYASAPTSYLAGMPVTINGIPTRDGYIFTGWCTDSELTECDYDLWFEEGNQTLYASWTPVKFTINTVDLSYDGGMAPQESVNLASAPKGEIKGATRAPGGGDFGFYMSAAGKFWIDWGDGTVEFIDRGEDAVIPGPLTSVNGGSRGITKSGNTDYSWYSHNYSTGGVKTIKFGGLATEYSEYGDSAISFNGNSIIASVDGSLGALFPTLGDGAGQQPSFVSTFYNCSSLTTIPATLFSGVTGAAEGMFASTFYNCNSLETIPAGLFSGVTGAAEGMFDSTFADCSNLETIPAGLFSGVSGAAEGMFQDTFYNCNSLTTIPVGLFSGVSGAADNMFGSTFADCSNLETIPAGLFSGVTGAAEGMFSGTFAGCSNLETIPAGLFSGVSGAADNMFQSTFADCSNLETIPAGLFSGVSGAANNMFDSTFYNCNSLTTIPATLFSGVSGASYGMFQNTFADCSNLTTIPAGLFSGVTGAAESMFNSTFYNCTSLTTIPVGLFSGVTGAADYMFQSTFQYCNSLTTISAGLFSGVTGAAEGMFSYTFYNCTSLTTIPAGLFSGVTGAADYMFQNTFNNCNSLTTIPAGLFSGVSGAADYMFSYTFRDCDSLTTIPAGLFSGVTGAAWGIFQGTFEWCYNLRGFIQPSVFQGLIDNNVQYDKNMFNSPFYGTNLATSCPNGTTLFETGYEPYWNGKVACSPQTYQITYDLNGGTNYENAPTSYTTGDRIVIDGVPTKAGYGFAGWCVTAELPENCAMVQTISESDYGDKAFYAKWGDLSAITYELNGGTNYAGAPERYTQGGYTVINGIPTKAGYGFAGWCWDAELTDCDFELAVDQSETEPITVYAKWIQNFEPKFTITTVNMSDQNKFFGFGLSAAGTFMVDWGDGTIETIVREDVEDKSAYGHEYATGGVRTIKFTGVATEYQESPNPNDDFFPESAITFDAYEPGFSGEKIASVSGSLGALFPTLVSGDNRQPVFARTFSGCDNLTTVPATLFNGVSGAAEGMFGETFQDSGLVSIPSGLFSGITGGAYGIFVSTFAGCYDLVSIPANLFSGITSGAESMFDSTFADCESLETVPAGLFSNVRSPAAFMFLGTFSSCANLRTLPDNLFGNIGAAEGMFNSTFDNCSNLTTIPADLFSGVSGAADYMFASTFADCSNLETIPAGLFSGVNAAAPYMFQYTFSYCERLRGYIPSTTFFGLIDMGSPYADGMFEDTFNGTNLSYTCPAETKRYNTKYERYWNGYVSCEPGNYSINYELDDGVNYANAPESYASGYSLVIDGVPTKDGYGFAGWCVDEELTDCALTQTIESTAEGDKTFWAKWIANFEPKFTITTTNMSADSEFKFGLSAAGTFMVDWGDGVIEKINRLDTDYTVYAHEYATAGARTIKFTGTSTEYQVASPDADAVISFSPYDELSGDKIASVDGSLGALFPTLGSANNQQPVFVYTFSGAANLTAVPTELFSDISGNAIGMFAGTFQDTGLTSVPAELFSNVSGSATGMFVRTFNGCYGLTDVPGTLFNTVSGGAEYMFYETFEDAGLLSVPSGLFSSVTSAAPHMFEGTFDNCIELRGYIPASMFTGLVSAGSPDAEDMMTDIFANTLLNTMCPIGMTEYNTGYEEHWNNKVSCVIEKYTISYELNGGTNYAGAPESYVYGAIVVIDGTPTKDKYTFVGWCTDETLNDCALTQTITATSRGNKTFWAKWSGTDVECNPGEYLRGGAEECSVCLENYYCPGGTFDISDQDDGINECPQDLVSPAGTATRGGCGKKMHVGQDVLYLASDEPQTKPALAVRVDGEVYYANTTPVSDVAKPININATTQLRTMVDGVEYSIHDNTI